MGHGYGDVRRPDPRIASAIWAALGDASSVVNVGAGAGSYEPEDREPIAVEPSALMIAQRPPGAAPAIQATAEALPLGDQAVDAAMAVLTMQHWEDVQQGVRELVRVVRRRVVLVTMDVEVLGRLWLIRDYLPETLADHAAAFPSISQLLELLPGTTPAAVPVPRDRTDGFMGVLGPTRGVSRPGHPCRHIALASVGARNGQPRARSSWARSGKRRVGPALRTAPPTARTRCRTTTRFRRHPPARRRGRSSTDVGDTRVIPSWTRPAERSSCGTPQVHRGGAAATGGLARRNVRARLAS